MTRTHNVCSGFEREKYRSTDISHKVFQFYMESEGEKGEDKRGPNDETMFRRLSPSLRYVFYLFFIYNFTNDYSCAFTMWFASGWRRLG